MKTHRQSPTATIVDFAIEQMLRLPRLPVRRQDLVRLRGLVRLNQMVATAAAELEKEKAAA